VFEHLVESEQQIRQEERARLDRWNLRYGRGGPGRNDHRVSGPV
jgi:hypothetical protein